MAGDWLKMRTDLAEDPAVIAMAATLDVDEDLIVGKLHRLWSWADRQSRDGHAVGVTQKWIDRFIRLPEFAATMAGVGWLVIDDTGVHFPNFDRHNGETAKTRALGAKRKQKERAEATDSVPDLSRNDRDKSVTREEKRREEKKEQEQAPAPLPTASVGAVCDIAVPLSDATDYLPPADLLAELHSAFPGVNIPAELRKARAWCIANPAKRKTRRGMPQFLNNWMSGASKDAGTSRGEPAILPRLQA